MEIICHRATQHNSLYAIYLFLYLLVALIILGKGKCFVIGYICFESDRVHSNSSAERTSALSQDYSGNTFPITRMAS